MKINCLIVDDDEVDRLMVAALLEAYPFIEVSGSFGDPLEALEFARKTRPDAIFLDIDMPEMDGLQLRQQLLKVPACIFITSYPDFALDGFELQALDFLVKPFKSERLDKAIQRLKEYQTIRERSEILNHALGADTIFIKDGTVQVKLQLHEIIYLEALNNYTSIITTSRKYTVLTTLAGLLKETSFQKFIRIHRSYAVQKNYISKISAGELLVGNITLPVGRSYKEALKDLKV